jgi:hypothetical protein
MEDDRLIYRFLFLAWAFFCAGTSVGWTQAKAPQPNFEFTLTYSLPVKEFTQVLQAGLGLTWNVQGFVVLDHYLETVARCNGLRAADTLQAANNRTVGLASELDEISKKNGRAGVALIIHCDAQGIKPRFRK